jgi:long-chain fatty acid transport protein
MKIAGMLRTGIAVSASIFLAAPAVAGGLYLYEVGSPDVGLAAAGYAARAQDASTVFTNPAGMTRLDRPEIQVGVQPMFIDMKFSPDSSTTNTGSGGDPGGWIPAGSLFYAHPVSKDLSLGFGVFGNFGLSLEYEDDWVGRYYVREATLQGLTFMPSVAYRLSPRISVGAGLGVMYATFKNTVALNNTPFGAGSYPDGQLKLEDSDWGFNGKFGILYEPTRTTRFGATYTTQTVLNFSSDLEWSGLRPGLDNILASRGRLDGQLNLGMRAPQAVMVSAFHDVTERLALMANVGWEQWSRFGKVDVGIVDNTAQSLTADLEYKDTWHGALGAQYRVSDPWLLSAGVAYDSAMLDDDQRGPALPVGDTWRFALGGQYRWNPKITVSGAYELAWSGNLPVNVNRGPVAGTVSGEFKDAAIHVLSLTLNHKF